MSDWAIVGLGAWHGINPAMGWLFAVALGLQERSRWATARALPPLAAGHAAAVLAALAVAELLGLVLDVHLVGQLAAAALIGFGLFKLRVRRHPRFGGMRVGPWGLAGWSFLMASAHGAGLMLVPFALGSGQAGGFAGHSAHLAGIAASLSLFPAAMHTASYLATVGLVAWIVHTWVGVGFLRRWWVNTDLVWASALIVTGVVGLLSA